MLRTASGALIVLIGLLTFAANEGLYQPGSLIPPKIAATALLAFGVAVLLDTQRTGG